jgi:protein-export membrane protein SecD/preprotein translocase SecF subunit
MKSFFWKFFICIVPVAITGWFTWDALDHGRFKKGVDLSGGTILVYEIDTRKLTEKLKTKGKEDGQATSGSVKPDDLYQKSSSELASALKQRIDPTSTFSIVIRPSGAQGRVEIIIPTGDPEKVRKAELAWKDLLDAMNKRWKVQDVQVPRGRVEELVDQIQQKRARELWEEKLLNNPEAWDRLVNKLGQRWKLLNSYVVPPRDKQVVTVIGMMATPMMPVLQGLAPADTLFQNYLTELRELTPRPETGKSTKAPIEKLIDVLAEALDEPSRRVLEADIRDYAWQELIVQLVHWDKLIEAVEKQITDADSKLDSTSKKAKLDQELKWLEEDLLKVPVDNFQELVGRVQAKGNLVGQAGLESLQILLGDIDVGLLKRGDIEKFISERYGPSAQVIEKTIAEEISPEKLELIRDPSLEDVQRVKDLVSKVGALEFKMLANRKDDHAAIEEIMKYINRDDAKLKEELDKAAQNGLPPPVVTEPGRPDEPKKYKKVKLARGAESDLSYSWVELGKQERRLLGFSNDAQSATGRDQYRQKIWLYMDANKDKAVQVPDPRKASEEVKLWEGALFYRRECKDRNLPEKERRAKKYEYFVLARNPEYDPKTGEQKPITGKYLRSAGRDMREGRPSVTFSFTSTGGDLFGTLTGKNVPDEGGTDESQFKRHLAIILDGLVMSAPTINSKITHSGQITGDFTAKEVDNLVNILQSGALPASLKPQPVSETTIGPLLGQDTINAGVMAVIIAFGVVVVFMCGYYRFAGFVACVALFANLIITVGFMVMVQATFTLPGLAGLVLMLGMAVDANVLIYERLREERDRGASLTLALRNGYERALPTIIDTHLTSIFTAIVLYAVGTDQLRGFAITLAVGLLISLFTSLYMTHVLFDFWQANGWLRKLSMGRLLSKPNVNFMGIRNYVFCATSIVTVLGLILFLARTPHDLDIDFKGGTAFTGKLNMESAEDIPGLRRYLEDDRQKQLLNVAAVKQTDKEGREFDIVFNDPNGQRSKPYRLVLANRPEGEGRTVSDSDREKIVKDRASSLPDWSVEQIFFSEDLLKQKDATKSRFFTVRTSEKERGLVDVMLVRLFQERIVAITKIDTSGLATGNTVKLTFDAPASVGLVHATLRRELRDKFGVNETTGNPKVTVDVTGVGKPGKSLFSEMQVTFTLSEGIKSADIEPVLVRTQEDFKVKQGQWQPVLDINEVKNVDESRLLEKNNVVKFTFEEPATVSFLHTALLRELQQTVGVDEQTGQLRVTFQITGVGASKDNGFKEMQVAFSPPLKPDQVEQVKKAVEGTKVALSQRPQPERLENFDSELAADTRTRALIAIVVSWVAIILYLWFRFGSWTFGLAAVLCLIHDLCFTLGFIAISVYIQPTWIGQLLKIDDFKIDLNGVAALLTLVGYSVADTIVVFDRIREVRGKNPELTPKIINDSINQTLSRTLLTSFTTFAVVVVLFWFGGPGVHLFAFIMTIGVIIGTLSSIYVASPLLLILGEGQHVDTRQRRPQVAAEATV